MGEAEGERRGEGAGWGVAVGELFGFYCFSVCARSGKSSDRKKKVRFLGALALTTLQPAGARNRRPGLTQPDQG